MVGYVGFGNPRPLKRNPRGLAGVSYKSAGFIFVGVSFETHGTDQGLLARDANPGYDRVSNGLCDILPPKREDVEFYFKSLCGVIRL
jgi:hypothetical protein